MFALVQQTFLAEKALVKSLLISTLDKVITTKEHFYRTQQNLPLQHKIGWRLAEKIILFINIHLLVLRFLWFGGPRFDCLLVYKVPFNRKPN
jgi:hypothetical protein